MCLKLWNMSNHTVFLVNACHAAQCDARDSVPLARAIGLRLSCYEKTCGLSPLALDGSAASHAAYPSEGTMASTSSARVLHSSISVWVDAMRGR